MKNNTCWLFNCLEDRKQRLRIVIFTEEVVTSEVIKVLQSGSCAGWPIGKRFGIRASTEVMEFVPGREQILAVTFKSDCKKLWEGLTSNGEINDSTDWAKACSWRRSSHYQKMYTKKCIPKMYTIYQYHGLSVTCCDRKGRFLKYLFNK